MSQDKASDVMILFTSTLLAGGSLYTLITFFITNARLFIHSYDIYKNLKYLTKDKTFTIPYKKLVLSIALLSFLLIGLYYTKSRETFSYFITILILFIPSVGFLMKTIGVIIKNYLEMISEFIAGVRYEKSNSSKEYQWKLEQEQWLLLLDLINTNESIGETLITVDASICGKDQPLTVNNRWKLKLLDYIADDLTESQISLRYALPFHL